MPDDERYMTLQDVADLLHVSPRTVFNMTRDGRLPARRLPGTRKYLYLRSEITQLVDSSIVNADELDEADVTE